MKRTFLFLLLLVLTIQVNAQSLLDKVPPSPTAASIIGASEINTSKFTGTPNISIPLYQVGYHNMSVPISLSYNAQGIKVNDVPGWVGTNWSLNAGGVITRMVNGLADDMPTSGYFAAYGPYSNNGLTKVDDVVSFDKGELDGHPDVYSFSFPGGSGKFMIDHNKNIIVLPHNKTKVEFLNGTVIDDGFKITTLDGTQYTFDVTETTQVGASANLPTDTYVSAWYLKKIESPVFPGKSIDFTYTTLPLLSDIVKIKSYSATRRFYTGAFYPANTTTTVSERFASYQTKRLNGISWGTGSVEFVSTTGRSDLSGDNVLDAVKIKDNNGLVIKELKMTYGYYPLVSGSTSSSGKLRLDQVQEYGEGGVSNPAHVFTYESSALPDYNYTGQDYWGYNNGKGSNIDLLPKQTVDFHEVYTSVTYSGHYNIGNADRQPVESELKKGILLSIQYPTGGVSEFEMESHRYSSKLTDSFSNQFQSTMTCGLANLNCTFKNEYDYLINTFGDEILSYGSESITAEIGPESTPNTETVTFTIPHDQKVSFDIDIDQYSTTAAYVKLEKNVAGNWVQVFMKSSSGPHLESLVTGITYRLLAYSGGETEAHSDKATISASWVIPTGITDLYGPGLRVKQVNQREKPGGSIINVRKFSYLNDQGESSGILYNEPIFSFRKFGKDNPNTNGETIFPIITQRSSSAFQHFGDQLGYSQVIETIGASGENGRVIDIYNANPSGILGALAPEYTQDFAPQQQPFAPSFYAHWSFGQLLESTVYRKKKTGELGDDYKKVQYTKNTYDYMVGNSIKGLSIGSVNVDDLTQETDLLGTHFFDEVHYIISSVWDQLVKTEQTVYSNMEEGQKTTTEMTYETTPGHLQVKSQTVTGSDGRKTISEYTYPLDYTTAHPYAANLVANNMHGAVIEELNLLDINGTREILSGKITKYNGTALQPEEVFTLKVGSATFLESSLYKSTSYSGSNALMDDDYESRITFTYQDGNLIEQQQMGGPPITYIWGYGNQYPVAKVQNLSRSDIEGANGFSTQFPGTGLDLGIGGLSDTQAAWLRGLKKGLVMTMKFKIGEGMQSQTTPNGLTTYYEYDSFNRLKYVKDKDDNILKKMEYAYKVNANTTNN